MGLGKNIQKLRTKAGLTQKELAEKLFVTAQAVSRWEQEIVEPNIQTLKQMSEIFNVSINEIIEYKEEGVVEVVDTETKQILTMCDTCHKPIYVGDEVKDTKIGDSIVHECEECYIKRKRLEEAKIKLAHKSKVDKGSKRRTAAIIASSIVGTLLIVASIVIGCVQTQHAGIIIPCGIGFSILFSMFLFVMILGNTFIPDFWMEVASWGFVRFPGLIFTLDLDGIIWLLTVKLLFWILGFILAAAAFIGATLLGMF